jgi:hypothetical protein
VIAPKVHVPQTAKAVANTEVWPITTEEIRKNESGSKWNAYENRIDKLLELLIKKRNASSKKIGNEVSSRDVYILKKKIKATMRGIEQENSSHTRFVSLAADAPECQDDIDLEAVVCSRCGKSDEEDNDILLCDRTGCCRAYHFKCLDPVPEDASSLLENEDWFCWPCDTLNNCLSWINKGMKTSYETTEELFPELKKEAQRWENANNGHAQTGPRSLQAMKSSAAGTSINLFQVSPNICLAYLLWNLFSKNYYDCGKEPDYTVIRYPI